MGSEFDKSKLAFANSLSYIVVIKQVGVADSFLEPGGPLLLVFSCGEV